MHGQRPPGVAAAAAGSPGMTGAAGKWFVRHRGPTAPGGQDVEDDLFAVALRYADEHLEGVSRNLDQFARRDAQQSYLAGAFSCASALFLLLMAGAFGGFELLQTDVVVLLVAFGSGGIGALVSVMLRVMNQPLQIDYHVGKPLMFLAGVFRPVLGALFGVIFFVLLNAGILQAVKLPDERDKFLYFVAAITFLAGFSERRAQDILVRASPLGGDKPSEQTASPPPR
jgi:hypothetical protein